MDDYLAIYHKTSDAQLISFVYEQSLGRGRFLREEVFGARKTLKRLDHMNPAVGIDRMDDCRPSTTKGGKINHF